MVRNSSRPKSSKSDLASTIKREPDAISSTTEITKKIKKIPKQKIMTIKKKGSLSI